MDRILSSGFGRILLSDELPALDDDIDENEILNGEEPFEELNFELSEEREYEPEEFIVEESGDYGWSDPFYPDEEADAATLSGDDNDS